MDNMNSDGYRKINPLFIRPKKENDISKKLDEVGEKRKRTIRKDWSPRLAKNNVIVDTENVNPSLSDGSDVIEIEEIVESITPVIEFIGDPENIEEKENDIELKITPQPSRFVVPKIDTPSNTDNTENITTTPSSNNLLKGNSDVANEFGSRKQNANSVPTTPERTRVTRPVSSKRNDIIFLGAKEPADSSRDLRTTRSDEEATTPVKRLGIAAAKDESLHVDQRPSVLKAKPGVQVEDWTNDKSSDTDKGFGGENDKDFVEPELGTGFHLTNRDITIIRFLARYRYAYNFQIARLVRASVKGIRPRLRVLAERGFVRKQVVTGAQHIWLSTKAGNLVTDIDLPAIKKGDLSWTTVAHTLGLVNVGIELETGGENLLKEDVWPTMNNTDIRGNFIDGERIITEKEIRAGQQKWRMNRSTSEMRAVAEQAVKDPGEFEVNEQTGEVEFIMPPETLEGNEGLFVIYSPDGEHIPDMVVSRGRDVNGKPINIAIELELNEKTHADWRRILRAYKEYGEMFDKIVYFTHKRNISNQLHKINNSDIHLPDDKFMIRKYIPKNGREPFWG